MINQESTNTSVIPKTQAPEFFWRYGVKVFGTFKRCRKSEWHNSRKDDLGKDFELNWDRAQKLASLWIEKNMKSYHPDRVFVTATRWRVEGESETWNVFSIRDNLIQPFAGFEN